jgi:Flp pilus assembly protein TadD/TolB-like protein
MALDPGTRLGTFEVLGPLGAGGMGEVYRAADTRLKREVALKILPEAFAQDPMRLARFEREARLLASLNHPGLAAIYGLEEAGPIRYIVMELVPGETLAQKLASGPLPIRDALDIAGRIAEALEAAHEAGVIHRDLKPANIKVTPQGAVKVLDLGLAKAMDPKSEPSDASNSPTMILDQTRPGMILGTAEFMSPEQARGKTLDKRTDIWSFGCVLFEMLSGQRPFRGETISDVIASILASEPKWSDLPAQTPSSIRNLLQRCLEKDVNQRLRDVGDARIEIAGATSSARTAPRERPSRPSDGRRFPVVATIGIIALAVALAWIVIREVRTRAPAPPAGPKYLVVLPFKELSGTPQSHHLGEGFVEMVSARLSGVAGVQVVTPSVAVAASDRESNPIAAAKSVGANLVLKCTIQREGDRVRIAYVVLSTAKGLQLTGGQVTGSAADLFALQDELTDRIASSLDLATRTRRTPAPSGLENADEQERYIEAVGLLQRYDKRASVEDAVTILEPLAKQRPGSGLVQAALGRAYLYEFNLTRDKAWADKAAASIEQAKRLSPSSPEVDATLGELLVRTGKTAEAIAAFRRTLDVEPNNYDALLGLARAYDAAHETANAESTYRRAIALQPDYWAGYSKLAGHFYAQGQYAEAAAALERVTRLSPQNSRAFSNLGAAYELLGQADRATAAYQRAIAIEPTHLAYSNLGTIQFFDGAYAVSAESFRKATELTPNHPELWANLGDALGRLPGKAADARAAYTRCVSLATDQLKVNPKDPLIHSTNGLCLARLGRAAEARREVDEALDLEPRNPERMYAAAVVAVLADRRPEALSWLTSASAAGASKQHIAKDPVFETLRNDRQFRLAAGVAAD